MSSNNTRGNNNDDHLCLGRTWTKVFSKVSSNFPKSYSIRNYSWTISKIIPTVTGTSGTQLGVRRKWKQKKEKKFQSCCVKDYAEMKSYSLMEVVLVWKDFEKVLEMDSSDYCRAMWMYLVLLNRTLKKKKKYYVHFTIIKKNMLCKNAFTWLCTCIISIK